MLDASGGGGYGGTNWMGMDVVQMWQAVQSQDTTAHYQVLDGWRKSYELTLQHLGQVQNYRQSLAEAWPPEKSPAAGAYIDRLDVLITNLQSTYDAAVASHDAFAAATLAISLSRNDVEKIYNEYTANQTKLTEFANKPKPVSKYVAPQKPPVADGRQEELNNQARSIMFGLSGEIIQARSQIKPPPPYKPEGQREKGDTDNGDGTLIPPPIPPVRTYDPSPTSSSSTSATHQTGNTHTASPGTDPASTSPTPGRQPGLILGGTQPTPIAPPPVTGIGPQPPIVGGGGLPNVITPTPVLPLPPGGTGTGPVGSPPGVGITKGIRGEMLGRPGPGGLPEGGLRAMPPGGVIGGAPRAGLGQPAMGGRAAASRVNPVGGVINPNNAESRTGPGGRSAGSGQHVGNLGGRNPNRHDESDETLRWDPDNPWETAEGVSPVVVPQGEQRIDPGPAIGLH